MSEFTWSWPPPVGRLRELRQPRLEDDLQLVEETLLDRIVPADRADPLRLGDEGGRGVPQRLRPARAAGLLVAAGGSVESVHRVAEPADLAQQEVRVLQRLLAPHEGADPHVRAGADHGEGEQSEQETDGEHPADGPPGEPPIGDPVTAIRHDHYCM